MDERPSDDDLRALRALDPAAGKNATEGLRNRVTTIPDTASVVRMRARRRWLIPAAVGLVAAAVGGIYIWGTGGLLHDPAVAPLAVQLGTPGDPAAPIGISSGTAAGGMQAQGGALTGQTDVGGRIDFGMGMGLSSGQHRFVVPEFETTPAEASVYAVDARAQFSAEDAARMAGMLGITGDVRANEDVGGWTVGDMPGPRLFLSPWGAADASYNSGVQDPVAVCESAATALHGRDKLNDDGSWAFGQEMIRCMAETPLPSDELVNEVVDQFLAATGVDKEAVEVTIMAPDESSRTVTANAAKLVGGNVTELAASFQVSAQGVISASGSTGEVFSLGEYAIVSAAEGATRLSDPAFSPRLVSWPDTSGDDSQNSPPTDPPRAPEPGSLAPWPIAEHEIVGARLGLTLIHGANGEQYLVPAYEFTAADETVWSVLALAEDELDTTVSSRD